MHQHNYSGLCRKILLAAARNANADTDNFRQLYIGVN
jgi:hypothetical protein